MQNNKLVYTKAIKNGKVKATEIGVGESIAGILVDVKENKYGTFNPIVEVNGSDVEIYAAGNLKFLAKDVEAGKRTLGVYTVITRRADGQTKSGYPVTQFDITQDADVATQPTPQAAAANAPVSIKDKLAAIRNNKANS